MKLMQITSTLFALLLAGSLSAAVGDIKLSRQISTQELTAPPTQISIHLYEFQQGGKPVLQQVFYAGEWTTDIDLSQGLPATKQMVAFELQIAASEAIQPGQVLWADFMLDGKTATQRFAVKAPTTPTFTIVGDIEIADPSRGIYFGDGSYQDTASPLVSTGAATQSLDMGGNLITNLNAPTAATDAATKAYVDAQPGDNLGSHQAGQNLNMQNHNINNLANPLVAMDAATRAYVDAEIARLALFINGGVLGTQGTGLLNDTGITDCFGMGAGGFPCPQSSFTLQDGDVGRDDTHDDDADGHAGFSFTKLDASGNDLAAVATSWQCVRDEVTGLIWEVKTDDSGLQDKDHTYTWYLPDPAPNGGDPGVADGGSCSGSDCDTYHYVNAVNQQILCGASDWRLPTVFELQGIVDYSTLDPAIDSGYFPYTISSAYWSGSPFADNPSYAWYVYFFNGDSDYNLKSFIFYVRLVRGGQ